MIVYHFVCLFVTIQKSVSLANVAYSSIVESTLKIRQIRTTMNLKKNKIKKAGLLIKSPERLHREFFLC